MSSRAVFSRFAFRSLPPSKGALAYRTSLGLVQPIQHRSGLSRLALSIPRHSLQPISISTYSIRKNESALKHFQTNSHRTYVTSTPSRLRKIGRSMLKLIWTGAVVFISAIGVMTWYKLHPPELADWPANLREPLVMAGIAADDGNEGAVLMHLTEAWKRMKNTTMEALGSNPFDKFATVAICLADALESNRQVAAAYKVLTEIVDLHQKLCSSSEGVSEGQPDRLMPKAITEKRRLISVFLKLSNLSEGREPSAEGRWLSRAIGEAVTLLPSDQKFPWKEFALMIKSIEDLSTHNAALSGVASELTFCRKTPILNSASNPDDTNSAEQERLNPDPNPNIAMEEIVNDENHESPIHFPAWSLPDIASVIAVAFECVGIFAEKHGHKETALLSFDFAAKALDSMTAPMKNEDASPTYWQNLVRIVRLCNRRTAVYLHILDEQTHAADWFYILHEVDRSLSPSVDVANRVARILNIKHKKEWGDCLTLRVVGRKFEAGLQRSLCLMYAGVLLEKSGGLDKARAIFEASLEGLPQKLYPEELKKIKEHLRRVGENKEAGKTTIRSQMNPLASEEWDAVSGLSWLVEGMTDRTLAHENTST